VDLFIIDQSPAFIAKIILLYTTLQEMEPEMPPIL